MVSEARLTDFPGAMGTRIETSGGNLGRLPCQTVLVSERNYQQPEVADFCSRLIYCTLYDSLGPQPIPSAARLDFSNCRGMKRLILGSVKSGSIFQLLPHWHCPMSLACVGQLCLGWRV